MDNDFKPAKRPAKSLRAALEARSANRPKIPTESFKTPEEVAAADDVKPQEASDSQLAEAVVATHELPPSADKTKKAWLTAWHRKLDLHWPPGKKEYILAACLLLLVGLGVGGWLMTRPDRPLAAKSHAKALPPKPTTVPSTLTGLLVDPSVNQRPVTGVMIENSTDARPQSGLSEAGVVFEAIAEGGITRFLALYQDTAPGDVGPIRSARPYYIQWALGFDAGYAHVGGSPEALNDIKAWGVRDLDQFANAGSYHRVGSRAAPHNVYTSIGALNDLEKAKGFNSSTYTGFARKSVVTQRKQVNSSKKLAKQPALPGAKTIDLSISGPVYSVHYDYNEPTKTYNRSEGGAPHNDANGNKPISPKVVIAMVMQYGIQSDGKHSDYQVVGSGPVYIFQDNTVATGTWTKTGDKSQITFTDSAGKPIELDPGQAWVTAVSDAGKVTYAP